MQNSIHSTLEHVCIRDLLKWLIWINFSAKFWHNSTKNDLAPESTWKKVTRFVLQYDAHSASRTWTNLSSSRDAKSKFIGSAFRLFEKKSKSEWNHARFSCEERNPMFLSGKRTAFSERGWFKFFQKSWCISCAQFVWWIGKLIDK